MRTGSFSIWTRINMSISFNFNHWHIYIYIYIFAEAWVAWQLSSLGKRYNSQVQNLNEAVYTLLLTNALKKGINFSLIPCAMGK